MSDLCVLCGKPIEPVPIKYVGSHDPYEFDTIDDEGLKSAHWLCIEAGRKQLQLVPT